jgi:hypothetical protein
MSFRYTQIFPLIASLPGAAALVSAQQPATPTSGDNTTVNQRDRNQMNPTVDRQSGPSKRRRLKLPVKTR